MLRRMRSEALGSARGVEVFVETEVPAIELLGDVDDLAVVQAEVLHHVIDGLQAGDRIALNVEGGGEVVGGEAGEDGGGLVEGGAEAVEQDARGQVVALGELGRALAGVGIVIEGGDQPLSDIAVEMQQQIADTVAGLVGAPPDLLVGEGFDGAAHARPALVDQLGAGVVEEGVGEIEGRSHGWNGIRRLMRADTRVGSVVGPPENFRAGESPARGGARAALKNLPEHCRRLPPIPAYK